MADQERDCPICTESCRIGDEIECRLNRNCTCDSQFHALCAEVWIKINAACPVCHVVWRKRTTGKPFSQDTALETVRAVIPSLVSLRSGHPRELQFHRESLAMVAHKALDKDAKAYVLEWMERNGVEEIPMSGMGRITVGTVKSARFSNIPFDRIKQTLQQTHGMDETDSDAILEMIRSSRTISTRSHLRWN